MKTILLTLLIATGAFGSVADSPAQAEEASPKPGATAAPPGGASPKIQFAEMVYDFGKISSGEVVKHSFVFTNVGMATLEINDVRPGCGCTTAGTWAKQVQHS